MLKNIRKVEMLIEHKREQIERTRSIAERMTAGLEITGIRGTGEKEDMKIRLVELEEELGREIDRLIDLKLEVMKKIDKLEDANMIDVLYMRYFQHMKWAEIAEAKNKSLDWTYKTHRQALKNFFEKM